MAAVNSSPSGFSYAQAAKGRTPTTTSQAPSSKVTSGTATPATGNFSQLGPSSNWADDVEATVGDKVTDSRKVSPQEQGKSAQAKDSAVERTKSESRPQNTSSGVSSPDLAATSSTTTNTDDSSSAPNGASSSDTTWDTKSQNSASEPAWIAERKERQSSGHDEPTPTSKRGKKEPKESKEPALPQPPQKPVVLTDAPPPAVNPWAKRLETARPRTPIAQPAPRPSVVSPAQAVKENQRPKADSRKKANSVTSVAREQEIQTSTDGDSKKSSVVQGKRAAETRSHARQGSKPVTEDARVDSAAVVPGKTAQRDAQSLPNLTAVPPPVKDEVSWPTPEHAQGQERRDLSAEKETDDSGDAESTPGAKPREKTKWKPVPVTPTIVWQTEEMNRPPRGQGSERGSRGSNTGRGRGGLRGTPSSSKGGDRATTRRDGSQIEGEYGNAAVPRGRSSTADRQAMPPPPKPSRPDSKSGSREGRRTREQSRGQQQVKSTTKAATREEPAAIAGSRRTKSPPKMDSANPDAQDAKIPEPIPRQTPAAQTENSRDGADMPRDGPPIRRVPSDGKKEPRTFEGYNGKDWNSTVRSGKRNGRGRGARGDFSNGHQAGQAFTNGHIDLGAGTHPAPQSPSAYQTSRGFGFSHPGRGGWARASMRSQSIPLGDPYARFGPLPPHMQVPSAQTYYPGMYDFGGGVPISAVPYNPMLDHNYLMEMVSTQLEYYFSIDNLLKDMYLRKNMDGQGFVFLDVIANFNRVKQLTNEKDLIRAVCLKSENIEIRLGEDGKERLRRREGWEQFLLPKDQRETTAQNDGPSELKRPEQPSLQLWGQPPASFRSPPAAGAQQSRTFDPGFGMNGAVAQFAPFSPVAEAPQCDLANGEETRGRATKSPIRDGDVSPSHQSLPGSAEDQVIEPDVFPDTQASTLTVVVRMNTQRPAHYTAASRTFSNGSIDTRSIFSEMEKPAEDHAQPSANGEPLTNGDHSDSSIARQASPSIGRSPEKGSASQESMILWVKDKEVPQEKLPQHSTLEPYVQLRYKALDQRSQAATGNCPYDLDVLYQFWSHFLIRNFNNRMYGEFKYFAHDDALERHSGVGLQNLTQFYAKALISSNAIRDHIVKDYVELVKAEPPILQGLAFKQLRSAWRNGALNLKNRKKLADIVDEQLKGLLES